MAEFADDIRDTGFDEPGSQLRLVHIWLRGAGGIALVQRGLVQGENAVANALGAA